MRDLCSRLRIVASGVKFLNCSRTLLALAILAMPARSVHAYGPDGHHLVGAIADERLANTPAGKKVAVILDGMTLREAAVIPDTIRGWDTKGAEDPKNAGYFSSLPRIRRAASRVLESQSADTRHQFTDAFASLVSLHRCPGGIRQLCQR